LDARDTFIELVIEPFVESYLKGLTPNPCILCNRYIKFPLLLNEAEKRKAEFIATGHYARVEHLNGVSLLKKGIDQKKDQSYVLYVLRQEELRRLVLPLGDYTKQDVRAIAKELGLPVFKRPESQEICFVEDRNYFKFIDKLNPMANKPGPILDAKGTVIGTHEGIYKYTIGQRKGLGISSPQPLYVTKIDVTKNAIYVGQKDDAMSREFLVHDLNWLIPKKEEFRAEVKVRSMMQAAPASVHLLDSTVKVVFDEPQWAPAPGQSAVFYDGDTVIGGGIIKPESP
jgi:tRNA-specific 2-thiouridylase